MHEQGAISEGERSHCSNQREERKGFGENRSSGGEQRRERGGDRLGERDRGVRDDRERCAELEVAHRVHEPSERVEHGDAAHVHESSRAVIEAQQRRALRVPGTSGYSEQTGETGQVATRGYELKALARGHLVRSSSCICKHERKLYKLRKQEH